MTTPLRLVSVADLGVSIAPSASVPSIESEAQLRAMLASLSGVDAVGAEARAAKLATRSIKKSTKLAALDLAISMVDLTTLEGADTPGRVTSLCVKAMRPDPRDPGVPSAAAVCVYPDLVAHARSVLGRSSVAVAAVATAFPSGRASLNVKLLDVREAVAAGADEIDMVIDRGAFLSGRIGQVFDEVVAVKEACGDAHLKVILETGELVTYDNVRRASWIAMLGGADFIKTSTGKVSVSSTPPTALVMLEAVRDFAETFGRVVGVKVAGGIRTSKDAIRYLVLVNETVGSTWLSPTLFRFGASSLLNDLLMQRLSNSAVRTFAPTNSAETDMTEKQLANSQLGSLQYDPAPESAAVAHLRPSYGLFIDGEFTDPSSHEQFASINPANESTNSTVAQASDADVDRAVAAARRAYKKVWSKTTGAERAKYLYRIARIIQERSRELAVVETLDNGKPIRESRDVDVPLAAAHFFYYAGWADKLDHAGFGANPQPVGVAGQIIPWNFPLLMAAWKLAPALAAGNTCVLKPAETTSLSALLLAEIFQQAELPAGVVNIVTGDGATGAALVEHPDVDKIAFTGSTEVGRQIQRSVGASGKRLTLELGGKGANIVFDDAPIDEMIEGIIDGIFFNQGHVCCAGSRLLVQETIADEVLRRLVRRVEQLRVGDPMDKNTDVGAINSAAQLARIEELSAFGESEGATRYSSSCELPSSGYWFAPTVFANVAQSHRIARDEIFGPVLSVLTFRTPEEAVAKANNTNYGLACGVWSEKGSRTLWVAQRLRAGVIWANTYNRFDPTSPFGGMRESGFGREGGRHGLEAYLNV